MKRKLFNLYRPSTCIKYFIFSAYAFSRPDRDGKTCVLGMMAIVFTSFGEESLSLEINARSPDDRKEWLAALREAIPRGKHNRDKKKETKCNISECLIM